MKMIGMRAALLLGGLAALTPLYAQQLSDFSRIRVVEIRDDGWHAVYLQGAVPDLGCSLNDRAIISANAVAGGALLQASLDAQRWGSNVRIRVDGCIPIRPGNALTAPRLTKLDVI
jgi:hypothetical protein